VENYYSNCILQKKQSSSHELVGKAEQETFFLEDFYTNFS